ncbi:MAG: sulfite exporter TauE/SafE family protein [Arenicella sp.]
MSPDLLPILFLGFGLGIMHALDADHVMALLALNNQTSRLRRVAYCSAYWAIGHGGVLLFCGALLFGLGVVIPESLQWLAEFSVGVLLVCLGVGCFLQFRNASLKVHSHGEIQHIHWHADGHVDEHEHGQHRANASSNVNHSLQEKHKPLMIGMLHGLAGSAPVLALIPAMNQGHILLAVIYLLLFSIGMMLSMAVFGFSFAYCQQFMQAKFHTLFRWSRYALAGASIGLGAFWMFQASM